MEPAGKRQDALQQMKQNVFRSARLSRQIVAHPLRSQQIFNILYIKESCEMDGIESNFRGHALISDP